MESFSSLIQGENIVVLKWGKKYKYLGVPVSGIQLQLLDDLKR